MPLIGSQGSITYYYDGQEVWQDTTGVTSAPMYLILGLGVPSSGPVTVPRFLQGRLCAGVATPRCVIVRPLRALTSPSAMSAATRCGSCR